MDDPQPSQLNIQLACDDATDEELDRLTRELLSRLLETPVESAELASGLAAPAGTKGDPISLGSIVVQTLPNVLPAVIGVVQGWVSNGPGRTVKFKSKDFEFEGSPADLQKVLETYNRRKSMK